MSTADGSVLGNAQIFGSAPRNRAFNVVMLAEGSPPPSRTTSTMLCRVRHRVPRHAAVRRAEAGHQRLPGQRDLHRFRRRRSGGPGGTGATARTYFDCTFGANGIRRLLVCNNTTALQTAAAQVPEFTVAIVVVNSTIYGGSGGSVGTYSLAGGATEIAIHEMGHTAFGLADEYPYYAGGTETGHDHHPAGEPAEPNVTTQHQPRNAEVGLGGGRDHGASHDVQSELRDRWTAAPAPCPPERSACSKARITTIAARTGPSTTARCATWAFRSATSAGR